MSQREEGKTVFSFSSSSSYQEDDSTGRMSGARRIAVTSRWLDDTVSSGNSSPVGSPVINHMVVVDEIHDVKVEVLEAGLHSRGASSSFDSKIDEQFGKIERKKQRINVVSWSATNDWCSKVCHDDNDDSDEDEDERMDDQQHVNNTNRRKRSTLQKLGEMAPDLILLQDLNYEQTMKAMKYLTKAEEHLHDEYDGNEDLEPPVYKWFCCGHKHTSEPVKVSKSCNSDDDDEGVPSSLISPLASMGGNQSIISALLKNDVKKKIEADQDPDDLVNEYLPIIYNSETLKCVDCGAFWYSKTPQEAGSKSWDSTVPRFCNWGAFIFKPYDEEDDHIDLLVFNTHWDQGVEARRYASILLRQEVLNRMSVYNAITNRTTFIPTIIGGNLNSLPRSNALSILVQGQDLGAHNSDVNLLADSDDDDDDEDEQVEKIDKESLIIPCQRQLMPPQAAGTTLQKSATVKKEDDKDFVKIEEESEEEEASDASSESYSGTWFHNLNLQPTFVDFETNTFETVDYLFVSPCVKTMNLQILDADLSCGETHKPHVATLEM